MSRITARAVLPSSLPALEPDRPRLEDSAPVPILEARQGGYAAWLETLVAGNGPIRRLAFVDVRQSMANGGGPACLRLRVVADPATVDPRFLVDDSRLDLIADIVRRHWPVEIANADLQSPALIRNIEAARAALLEALGLTELA